MKTHETSPRENIKKLKLKNRTASFTKPDKTLSSNSNTKYYIFGFKRNLQKAFPSHKRTMQCTYEHC